MTNSTQESSLRPGPLGRAARILLGLILLRFFWGFVTGFEAVAQPGNIALYFWAAIGMFSHVLGTVLPPLRQERLRKLIVGFSVLIALGITRAVFHSWWGPPIAWTLYVLALAGMGILGLEFTLAGLVGQIGCEKTVIPNLLRRNSPPQVESCALWDPIDRWERTWRQGAEDDDKQDTADRG